MLTFSLTVDQLGTNDVSNATNTADAMKLFLVSPATLLAPREIVRPTTGPKNPINEYPTTGTTLDFQIIASPTMTSRQHNVKTNTRMFWYRELSQPVKTIPVLEVSILDGLTDLSVTNSFRSAVIPKIAAFPMVQQQGMCSQ